MKRGHVMPFGSAPGANGVHFRLWAPAAATVDLRLEGRGATELIPLKATGSGWFELVTDEARAGSRYRYRIDGNVEVPDPVSRYQPEDVRGPSEVIDPQAYDWQDAAWRGRPWHEAVLYELHVGAFTPTGTFEAATQRLPYLRELGVTAVELMPVADFPGARNWGYDGVLPFAPDSRYGRPQDLKRLVDEAHRLGLMVLLDVVYNHFGPDGNYLPLYAGEFFFSPRHQTPWGAALNFDAPGSRVVRDFFIHNALYWLEEFHVDGFRLDAVHAIVDDSQPHILTELAESVKRGPGRTRHVHLVLENDDNAARYLERDAGGAARGYDAQWNDDAHHALHVLLTGERDGYYADYVDQPEQHLGRALTEGFSYQDRYSAFRGRPRGESSRHLPPTAFVAFLQNHDQVGNRAFGERLAVLTRPEALQAALALLLLAPSIPMLFMGEEFGCSRPFPFFCDFNGDLALAVTTGRRREFASLAHFRNAADIENIPDPNAPATFAMAVLDWECLSEPGHAAWHAFVRRVLAVRHREIIPRLSRLTPGGGKFRVMGRGALRLDWACADGITLAALANLSGEPIDAKMPFTGAPIYICPEHAVHDIGNGRMPPWSVAWALDGGPQ
jgi:maltooligosyltrehalose trehalohydrolase